MKSKIKSTKPFRYSVVQQPFKIEADKLITIIICHRQRLFVTYNIVSVI